MAERRYPRPRSPLQNPGRSSLPSFGYPYTEVYTVPVRKDSAGTPRVVSDRAPGPGPITTTYTVKPELPPVRTDWESHHTRRSTLDGALRPTIVTAQPRSPAVHGGGPRPPSPLYDQYRSSGEGGEYVTIPASSGKRHTPHRQSYSATMDNADVHKLSREGGSRNKLGVGSGREGARYPARHRSVYPGALVRHPDTVADDYGDNGYGYTNPRDLVQYDLNRSARYPPQRRDSYEGSRPARPTSVTGYADIAPRSYDNRERGPPPATRGLDKLATRSPLYDAPPARLPPMESGVRSPRKEQFYVGERPRQPAYRRPVSIYQDRPRRDDYYDPRDDELRERRERPPHSKRYDDRADYRERSSRDEPNGSEHKRREHRSRNDYDSGNDSDDYDDRAERKNSRDKNVSREKDYEKRNDHERKDEPDDHKERKRDKLAAGISVAAAALGVGAAAKSAKHEDSDNDKDDSDDYKRRRDGEEHRRRREHRDDKGSVDLTGRDPKERNNAREDRDVRADDGGERKARNQQHEDTPVDLAGRNPQEKPAAKETRDDGEDSREQRRNKSDVVVDGNSPSSREDSPLHGETIGRRRLHKERGPGSDATFKATNTMDLRALRDALNNKDPSAPPAAPAEAVREGSFERKREPSTQLEPPAREGRGRRDTSGDEGERRPTPRLVSPPREAKKTEENKPRGILRTPREKFPEDPVPIREGVAPLKDAKKDGVPPDARWTKISRRMVNPEALDIGKERYEAREDFVIVLRVLTKEEIQGYAVATQQIRAAREQMDDVEERDDRRHRRRERHERHKRERERGEREGHHRERDENHEYDHDHRIQKKERDLDSESDTTPDDDGGQKDRAAPKLIDNQKPRRMVFDQPAQTSLKSSLDSSLKEDPERPGTYTGYTRNPPRKESRT